MGPFSLISDYLCLCPLTEIHDNTVTTSLSKCSDICIPDIPIWRWSFYNQCGGWRQQWMQLRQDEIRIANWEEYVVFNLNKAPPSLGLFPQQCHQVSRGFQGEEGSKRET